jgi:transcriptional regulator with GAF, ATPase, and Fis domain
MGLGADQGAYDSHRIVAELQRLFLATSCGVDRLLLREHARKHHHQVDFIGRSEQFVEFERTLKQVAWHAKSPVLIRGERGTGKECAAYAIHYFSNRRHRPFVPVLASALTESLLADELFGHARNSFTGAAEARKGKFLSAEGGTVFLDEVGDLPLSLQVALLRVMERGEIQPVGRDLPLTVDCRVVMATNRELTKLVAEGRFREDLYDRLNVMELEVPQLRIRRIDIPLLAKYFLRRQCRETGRMRLSGRVGVCHSCGSGGRVA